MRHGCWSHHSVHWIRIAKDTSFPNSNLISATAQTQLLTYHSRILKKILIISFRMHGISCQPPLALCTNNLTGAAFDLCTYIPCSAPTTGSSQWPCPFRLQPCLLQMMAPSTFEEPMQPPLLFFLELYIQYATWEPTVALGEHEEQQQKPELKKHMILYIYKINCQGEYNFLM